MESLFEELLQRDEILVLEHVGGGCVRVLGTPPAWAALLPRGGMQSGQELDPSGVLQFPDGFWHGARQHWESARAGTLESEAWTETLLNRRGCDLRARAERVGGRQVLVVARTPAGASGSGGAGEGGGGNDAARERSLRESTAKEILLDCMLHRLAVPLETISAALRTLQTETLVSPSAVGLVQAGRAAARRQRRVLREVLEVFGPELAAMEEFASDSESAPDVLHCAHAVLRMLRPTFSARGVNFELALSPSGHGAWKGAGDGERLGRLLFLLLDTVLAGAEPGSSLTLRLTDDGDGIRVSVLHAPPGAGGVRPTGSVAACGPLRVATGGRMPLVKLYCRTLMERWGGAMGENRCPGGWVEHWFRLLKPEFTGSEDEVTDATPDLADADSQLAGSLRMAERGWK